MLDTSSGITSCADNPSRANRAETTFNVSRSCVGVQIVLTYGSVNHGSLAIDTCVMSTPHFTFARTSAAEMYSAYSSRNSGRNCPPWAAALFVFIHDAGDQTVSKNVFTPRALAWAKNSIVVPMAASLNFAQL